MLRRAEAQSVRRVASVRGRLLLLIALLVIPPGALLWFQADQARADAVQDAHEDTWRLTHLTATGEARAIEGTRLMMVAMSWLLDVAPEDPERCVAALREAEAADPTTIGFSIVRPDGTAWCSSTPFPPGFSLAGTAAYERAKATGAFALGDFNIGRVSGLPTVALAYPVLGPDGALRGLVMGGLDLHRLAVRLAEGDVPASHVFSIVDTRGIVLARQPGHEEWVGQKYDEASWSTLKASAGGTAELVGLDGFRRIFGVAALADGSGVPGAYVLVGAPFAEVLAPIDAAFLRDIALLTALGMVALAAAIGLADRGVARPLERLARAAHGVAEGRLRTRTGLSHDATEVGQVARAFDEMAQALEAAQIREAEARKSLEAANERLREVDAVRAQFVNLAAHELANPLTPIQLQVQFLRSLGLDAPQQQRALEVLERNVQRLGELTRDVQDAARLREGRLALDLRPVDLAAVAAEVVELFQQSAVHAGLSLRFERDGPLPVLADPQRLGQAVLNLVSNAVKYTSSGGAVTVRTLRREGAALVVVEDTGRGFEPSEVGRLFQPFSRLSTDPSAPRGTGLGLYLARTLAEQHGGRLTGRSPGAGKGAVFELWLPLRQHEGTMQDEPHPPTTPEVVRGP